MIGKPAATTALLLLLVFALAAGGCFYERIKAKYKLPEQPTLVLVDDPRETLGDPFLAKQVANQIAFDLVRVGVIPEAVPLNRLAELQRRLGDDYMKTPIDQIGRELGALQVVHVEIISASIRSEPGVSRPTAQALVKVIDVQQRKRLWPRPEPGVHTAPRSYPMASEMFYRFNPHDDDRSTHRDLSQRFATEIGRDIAKLFYDHEPDIGQSGLRDN